MYADLGSIEVDKLSRALAYLQTLKIFREHNDFKEQRIDLINFDDEFCQYNNAYDIAVTFAENLLTTICSNIEIVVYEDKYKYVIENLAEKSLSEEIWNDIEICGLFIVIPININNISRINEIIEELNKKIMVLGIMEEYLTKYVYHDTNDNCLYIAMDQIAIVDSVIDPELVNILYQYKEEGII